MINGNRIPTLEEINLNVESDGNKRYVVADYNGNHYKVRIPLHVYKKIETGDVDIAKDYVQELMEKLRKGMH